MPQSTNRTLRISKDRYTLPDFHSENLSPTELRVLQRMGCMNNKPEDWLDWLVRFANQDISQASAGEQLTLKEELELLVKLHGYDLEAVDIPSFNLTHDKILEVYKALHDVFVAMADHGDCDLPRMTIDISVSVPHFFARKHLNRDPFPEETEDCIISMSPTPRLLVHNLLLLVVRLIEKSKRIVIRCPHCKNLFLQRRRNQEYCGRSCQSVAVMQRLRTDAKTTASTKPSGRKEGKQHGEKRR